MDILERLLFGSESTNRMQKTLSYHRDEIPSYRSVVLREALLKHYQQADQPRVPAPVNLTTNSFLLLLMLWKVLRGIEEARHVPIGTIVMVAANCVPFLKPGGFSLPAFGLSPFMVWEHRQYHRVVTSAFLHADFNHMGGSTNTDIKSSTCNCMP